MPVANIQRDSGCGGATPHGEEHHQFQRVGHGLIRLPRLTAEPKTPLQYTMYTASATTPLRPHPNANNTPAVNYGAVSPPAQQVQVLVDDGLPWPAIYQRRRRRVRHRGCCYGTCIALIRFFLLLTMLCLMAAGLLLVWEHRQELLYTLRNLGMHIMELVRSIIRWVGERLRG